MLFFTKGKRRSESQREKIDQTFRNLWAAACKVLKEKVIEERLGLKMFS